jgi:muramoyltetrapeptide carboxypeptidase
VTRPDLPLLKPRPVRPGDRLAVVAPASPFDRSEFDQGITELRRLGFDPVFDDTVFERRGYVAGEASVRAAAIHHAWLDPGIAAVIAVRGGYGSVQVLPHLDVALAREARKALIGYSDVTSLLSFLAGHASLVCFHGPTVAGRLGRGPAAYDRDSLLRALGDTDNAGRELAPPGVETIRTGEAAGALFGGTITQLVASLGTPFAFDPPPGHVLFLDDVGERPYRLDRMLTQLSLSGILGRAAALVFATFPRCDEPAGGPTARSVIADFVASFGGPVVFGFPSGHTNGPALTLPLGVRTRVIASGEPRLVFEEAAVED